MSAAGFKPLKLLLIACAVAVMTSPALAQSVREGIAAWQKSEFARAVDIWRPLATNGDADAAFNLGQAYRLGKGVPLSLASAQSWYERAARAGHVDAATSLGILLFQNGDRDKAMIWLRKAAEAGEPRALLLFGTALFNGDGVPVDRVLAYAYVSRAAAQGLAPARATLADMDSMIPLDERQRGLAIAQAKAAKDKTVARRPMVSAPAKVALAAPTQAKTPNKVAPKPVPVASGRWRIQLGAFSRRASAETLFRTLSPSLGGRQPYYVASGAVVRLQAGPYTSKADAASACSTLARRGQACFPGPSP